MTRKEGRQAAIVELVLAHEVGSQEELRQLLVERGMDVTQATPVARYSGPWPGARIRGGRHPVRGPGIPDRR